MQIILTQTNSNDEPALKNQSFRLIQYCNESVDVNASQSCYRKQRQPTKLVTLNTPCSVPAVEPKCHICKKTNDLITCSCQLIKFHSECIRTQLNQPHISIQMLQCSQCLSFISTEVQYQMKIPRCILSILSILLLISEIILMGIYWHDMGKTEKPILISVGIVILFGIIYNLRKLFTKRIRWRLDEQQLDQEQAFEQAKLIVRGIEDKTAQYMLNQ